jgi:hypothetical protein
VDCTIHQMLLLKPDKYYIQIRCHISFRSDWVRPLHFPLCVCVCMYIYIKRWTQHSFPPNRYFTLKIPIIITLLNRTIGKAIKLKLHCNNTNIIKFAILCSYCSWHSIVDVMTRLRTVLKNCGSTPKWQIGFP